MPKMRARVKMKDVAGDRARRENVPGHILSYTIGKFDFRRTLDKKSPHKGGHGKQTID